MTTSQKTEITENKITALSEGRQRSLANLKPFKKGVSGNPSGKKPGTISPITKVRQIFSKNPKAFKEFILGYIEDPNNRRHIVEMLDGKPKESIDISIKPKMVQLDD